MGKSILKVVLKGLLKLEDSKFARFIDGKKTLAGIITVLYAVGEYFLSGQARFDNKAELVLGIIITVIGALHKVRKKGK